MNIITKEIKATYSFHKFAETFLMEKGAKFIGLDHQVDTYFNTNYGRLKLREGNIESNLIHYKRPEIKNIKSSEVLLYKVINDPEGLKKVLAESNGIKCIVDKKRKIFFIKNVKFHLDEVEHLGLFIEIEAIGEKGVDNENDLFEQCQYYMDELKISEENLVNKSYSDLIIEKNNIG